MELMCVCVCFYLGNVMADYAIEKGKRQRLSGSVKTAAAEKLKQDVKHEPKDMQMEETKQKKHEKTKLKRDVVKDKRRAVKAAEKTTKAVLR